jgi:hypothetical protein
MPTATFNISSEDRNFVDAVDAIVTRRFAFTKATFTPEPNLPYGIKMRGQNFQVWERNVAIKFRFIDEKYRPLGIYFLQSGVNQGDPSGFDNMDARGTGVDVRKNYVKFRAKRTHSSRYLDEYRWKIVIPIENVATGEFGLVDPEISNTDQELTLKRKNKRTRRLQKNGNAAGECPVARRGNRPRSG